MDTNEIKPEQSDNRADLSSEGGDSSCNSGPVGSCEKTWKTVIFIIVVALAGTLAAHSMLTSSRCGGGSCGGKVMLPCCPAQADVQAAACPSEKSSLGAQDTVKVGGCPLTREETKACPNSPGAKGPGCCPGGRHGRGQQ